MQVTLDEGLRIDDEPDEQLLDLDEALRELEEHEARQARVVELRYLAGLEMAEVAQVLDVSKATVERDWRFARENGCPDSLSTARRCAGGRGRFAVGRFKHVGGWSRLPHQ